MCGIAGFHLKNPKFVKKHDGVERLVDKLLLGIESRGKHATGFVAVTVDNKVVMDKDAITAADFIKDRDRIPKGVQTVLLHTRWATKGPKEEHQNNHPVLFGTCFAVHNGHINNDDALFTELGVERTAEVDSVIIPAMIDKYGFENIGEALAKLHGNMATAFIDPIKHPKTLVLARGESSPLVTIENEHFIMWASLYSALRDAWAEVLGTPPAYNKFTTEKEGTIIVVNDTETTRSEYKVTRPFGFGTHGKTHGTGNTGSVLPRIASQDTIEEADAVIASKKEIAAFVKSDEATGRRWTKKDTYSDSDFTDARLKRWVPCYGCEDLVLFEDMRKTLNWGTICIDCHVVVVREIEKKMKEDADVDAAETLAGTDIPRIYAPDRDALEAWSVREIVLHNLVLEEMSKRVGSYYTPRLIEFLVFLTTPEYRDYAGVAVVDLIDKLRDMYEEEYVTQQEEAYHGGEVTPGLEDTQVIPLSALPPAVGGYPESTWTYCHKHEEAYKASDKCLGCTGEDASACGVQPFERAAAPVAGNVIELPRCGKCGTYVLKDKGECAVCKQLADEPQTPGQFEKVEQQHDSGKCLVCGRKPRIRVKHKNGGIVNYCKKHHTGCHKKDCDIPANHTLATGERRCHQHVRGVGGAVSDTTLIKRGIEITEVK